MKCPDCEGSGVQMLNSSHPEQCESCGGSGKKPKPKKTRLAAELDGNTCVCCGCGFAEDEPRSMMTMCGSFGGLLAYQHDRERHCIVALKEKVADLERLVTLQTRAATLTHDNRPPPNNSGNGA